MTDELKPTPITIEQLMALNDEIAALVRAGLPLEKGLVSAGTLYSGRTGQIIERVGDRLVRGESLVSAVEEVVAGVPRSYLAMLESGYRSNRLASALEGLTQFGERYTELRRTLGEALAYPLMVATLSYAMFLFFVAEVIPRFHESYAGLSTPLDWLIRSGNYLSAWVWVWGPVPIFGLFGCAIWWYRTRRAALSDPNKTPLRCVPGMGSILGNVVAAGYANQLALMVEAGVPLHEAVVLAAETSGNERIRRASSELSIALRRGEVLQQSIASVTGLPPLLRWLMFVGTTQDNLVDALKSASTSYYDKARYQAELMKVSLPSALLVLVGATTTFLYALSLFLPLSALLRGLTVPH